MLPFQHTLSYYVLPFFLPPLSLTPSPSLLFLPLPSSLAFMYPDLQLGGEREQERERERERERDREREEVTCISGVGTVCKLPCKLKSRKMHWHREETENKNTVRESFHPNSERHFEPWTMTPPAHINFKWICAIWIPLFTGRWWDLNANGFLSDRLSNKMLTIVPVPRKSLLPVNGRDRTYLKLVLLCMELNKCKGTCVKCTSRNIWLVIKQSVFHTSASVWPTLTYHQREYWLFLYKYLLPRRCRIRRFTAHRQEEPMCTFFCSAYVKALKKHLVRVRKTSQ